MTKAENDSGQGERDIDIPQELQRREGRLEKIAQIKGEIEQRAQARYEQEKAEYESKLAQRRAKEKARGRKERWSTTASPSTRSAKQRPNEFHRFRVAHHAGFWRRF